MRARQQIPDNEWANEPAEISHRVDESNRGSRCRISKKFAWHRPEGWVEAEIRPAYADEEQHRKEDTRSHADCKEKKHSAQQ